jgi:hypothetical protein
MFAVMPVPPMPITVPDLIRDLSVGMSTNASKAGSGNAGGSHIRGSEGHSSECRCYNQALLH